MVRPGPTVLLLCACSTTTNLIPALIDASPPIPCPADPDLIACLRFEGAVTDESTYQNAVSSSGVSFLGGRFGTSAGLTQDSSIRLAENPLLDPLRLTIEMWVVPAGNGTPHREGLLDNDLQYSLFLRTAFGASCAIGADSASAGGVIQSGQWNHLACVYDGDTITLYAGGLPAATQARQGDVPTEGDQGTAVGTGSSDTEPYEGRIDDLYLWRRVRTPEEICTAAGSC